MFVQNSKNAFYKLMRYYSKRNVTKGPILNGSSHMPRNEIERKQPTKIQQVTNGFEITFPILDNINGQTLFFDNLWLRDHCSCSKCYNWRTFQKEINYLGIADVTPVEFDLGKTSGKLHVKWSDNHQSTYNLSWLRENSFEVYKTRERPEQKLWAGNLKSTDFPIVRGYPEIKSAELTRQVLYNVFKYGFCIINDVAPTAEDTEKVVRQIAPVQKTYWGEMWSVSVSNSNDIQDTAFTNIHIPPHNDCTYFSDSPRIQIFHCIQKGVSGGETILVDGFRAAEILRKSDRASYDYLSTTAIESSFQDNQGNCYLNYDTIIKHSPITKDILQIRFNPLDVGVIRTIPQLEIRKFYKAYTALTEVIYDDSNQITITLEPGMVLFLDNWRALHGRNAFTGNRRLCGCNISGTDYLSKLRKLEFI